MSNQDFMLTSGARLHITSAKFSEASDLSKALLRSMKGVPLNDNLMKQDVTALKDMVIEAATSDDVERALHKCMERSTYNDIKLLPSTFDDPRLGDDFRKDYYEVAVYVVKVNCWPFFEKALSMLRERLANVVASQKPASF